MSLNNPEFVKRNVNLDLRETLLTAGTIAAVLLGITLILFFPAALSVVGVLLVIASAVLFLADMRDILGEWRKTREV